MESVDAQFRISQDLLADERDADRFRRNAFVCTAIAYGHYAVCLAGLLPLWTLALTLPVLVVRWMLAIHELFHLRAPHNVDLFTRLMPLVFTPLNLGYAEYRSIHFGHHSHHGTPDDPDHYHIRGGKLIAFLNALTAPEQSFIRWVAKHGVDQELIWGSGVRFLLFVFLAIVGGRAFLWYWIPLRIANGLSYFSFFYCLHRRGADHGVYPLRLAPWAARLFALLYGKDALYATCFHHIHHTHPRIAARHLPEAEARRLRAQTQSL